MSKLGPDTSSPIATSSYVTSIRVSTMRLRESVRPPQRYDAEFVYQPTTRRGPRSSSARNYVEYNPNLPPAAFPTLDKPRPVINSQSQQSQGRKTDWDGDVDMEDDNDNDELRHISIHDIDNYAASNGPQNPIYARNMAKLDQISRESSQDSDMSESQGDGDSNQDDNQNSIEVRAVCSVVS
ncbi:hypothetical protein VTN77DRAFT_8846 [Rasamsonia byssochlamydoides]|uniref:uncharacterized protein n=1 Tax=Rasamsonia byssochlamydoides TaxID=89139 RepID=UPI003742BEC8